MSTLSQINPVYGWTSAAALWQVASRPAWASISIVFVTAVTGCWVTGMRFNLWLVATIFVLYKMIFVCAAIRFLEHKLVRLALLVECYLVVGLIAVVVCLANVVLARSALPLRDTLLIEIDSFFGFSWLDTAVWFQQHPAISLALSEAYFTLHKQVPFLLLALAVFRPKYLRQFGSSWCLTLLATMVVFPFMPAAAGYIHYGLSASDFPNILPTIAWAHIDLLTPARAGSLQALDANAFTGIVTFPSFHAAGAVLLACAWWQVPGLRYPGIMLNVAMLISAIPCGGHYLADLIGGCAIAAMIVWSVGRYFKRSETSDFDVVPEPVSEIWQRHAHVLRSAPRRCLLAVVSDLCLDRRTTALDPSRRLAHPR